LISYRHRDSDSNFYIEFPSIGITFSAIFTRQSRRNKTENVFSPFAIRDPIISKFQIENLCLSSLLQIRINQRLTKIQILNNPYLENHHPFETIYRTPTNIPTKYVIRIFYPSPQTLIPRKILFLRLRDNWTKFMINLEIKILRFLNDPILNKFRKDLTLFSKGIIYIQGKALPEPNLEFKAYLQHFERKWRKLYLRIFREHSHLYWYFCDRSHFNTEQNLNSIGDIIRATEHQLFDVNFTRDICQLTRQIIRNTLHLQKLQDTEASRIDRAHSLFEEEFEEVTTPQSNSKQINRY